jgi:hypothetical protein
VHPDIILYKESEEEAKKIRMILPETPEYCPKCDRLYYKHQLKVKNE